MSEYIAKSAAEFIAKLEAMKAELDAFASQREGKINEVTTLIGDFVKANSKLGASEKTAGNEVELALAKATRNFQTTLKAWEQKLEKSRKGREFMAKHEKYLVVMVFGAVKCGKSSLGNFFAGREFRTAPFDNAYKTLPKPIFQTEEKGRESGGIVKDLNGDEYFAEGITDTTGDIQYFTLSGLRWIDSPGSGATGKDDDLRRDQSMDDLIKEYIPYADLCIFLLNSGQPGLKEDMYYFGELNREKQTAVSVVTRSDEYRWKMVDGKKKKQLLPKEDRVGQEQYVKSQIVENYPNVDPSEFNLMSISTRLAQNGVLNDDDEAYQASNLSLLMEKIIAKTGGDVVEFKKEKLQKSLNALIDNIISSDLGEANIQELRRNLEAVLGEITESQAKIDSKKATITKAIGRELKIRWDRKLHELAASVDRRSGGTGTLSDSDVARVLRAELEPLLKSELEAALTEIINGYEAKSSEAFQLVLTGGGIQSEVETIDTSYSQIRYETVERDGFFGKLKDFFFGKQRISYNETVHQTTEIDVGTNIAQYREKVKREVEGAITEHIHKVLDDVKEQYFAPQEAYTKGILADLANLEKALLAVRY